MAAAFDTTQRQDDLTDIASRATLYAALISALAHQRQPQPLPVYLQADLNVLTGQQSAPLPEGYGLLTVAR